MRRRHGFIEEILEGAFTIGSASTDTSGDSLCLSLHNSQEHKINLSLTEKRLKISKTKPYVRRTPELRASLFKAVLLLTKNRSNFYLP